MSYNRSRAMAPLHAAAINRVLQGSRGPLVRRGLGDLPYAPGFYTEDHGVYNPPAGGTYPAPSSYGGPAATAPAAIPTPATAPPVTTPGEYAAPGSADPVPVILPPTNEANRISVAIIGVDIARLDGTTQIIPLNYRRKLLVVQNNDLAANGGGQDTLLLGFGNSATPSNSIRIDAGGSAFFDIAVPNNSVFLGTLNGTMIISPTIMEGTIIPASLAPAVY